MAERRLEILHIGSASRDLAEDDPRGWRLGGAVTYAALTTARLGLRTAAVIGLDRAAMQAEELELLRSAGVDLLQVPVEEGPVFHNREGSGGRVQTCVTPGIPLPLVDLPAQWRSARAWSFAPVADEVVQGWARLVPSQAIVVVGWQGYLRALQPGQVVRRRPPERSALIARADLVGVSHNDVDPAMSLVDLAGFLTPGADLLVTRGAAGGLLVRVGADGPERVIRYRPTRAAEADPTGAGDTFLAALAASALRPAIAGRYRSRRPLDLRFAAAAGSLAVEHVGLAGVPDRASVNLRRAGERLRRALSSTAGPQISDYTVGAGPIDD